MHARRVLLGAAIAGIGILFACVDGNSPVSPKAPAAAVTRAPAAGASATIASADGVHHHVRVLRWTGDGLAHDVVGTAAIGPSGGIIRLSSLNVTFTVPKGALTARTQIRVRALAGKRIVFVMAPEGLHFVKPATLMMDLSYTNAYHKQAWARILRGGFIVSPTGIGADDGVDTIEDYPAAVDDAVTIASFPVPHFSVVILASQIGDPCTGICSNAR